MAGFKRKIFYLSGFDPRGPRFYHQLYCEQAALYSENAGHAISVGDRQRAGSGNSRWTIEDHTSGATTELDFLGWDDVIRAHWVKNPATLLWRSLKAYIAFSRQMDWTRGRHFPRGTLIAFYYPGISAVVLPIVFTLLLWLLFGLFLTWPWSLIGSLLAGLLAAAVVIRKIESFWLLRFIIFNDSLAANRIDPVIEARLDAMADAIDASFAQDWDEVLFVTHSNGSILSMPIMARLLVRHGGAMPAHFALMTLGSCIPLIGCRRDSHHFHEQLETVAAGDFLWLDLGSITDGACIALIDPVASCHTVPRARRHILSPRWFKYCDPATYEARRRNKYEVHFEYLRTFDRISPLDYIGVTSSDRPLAQSIIAFEAENAA